MCTGDSIYCAFGRGGGQHEITRNHPPVQNLEESGSWLPDSPFQLWYGVEAFATAPSHMVLIFAGVMFGCAIGPFGSRCCTYGSSDISGTCMAHRNDNNKFRKSAQRDKGVQH